MGVCTSVPNAGPVLVGLYGSFREIQYAAGFTFPSASGCALERDKAISIRPSYQSAHYRCFPAARGWPRDSEDSELHPRPPALLGPPCSDRPASINSLVIGISSGAII